MGYLLLLLPYIGENWGSEKVMNLSKMIESVSGIARTWRLRCLTSKYGNYLETNASINK